MPVFAGFTTAKQIRACFKQVHIISVKEHDRVQLACIKHSFVPVKLQLARLKGRQFCVKVGCAAGACEGSHTKACRNEGDADILIQTRVNDCSEYEICLRIDHAVDHLCCLIHLAKEEGNRLQGLSAYYTKAKRCSAAQPRSDEDVLLWN